MRKAPNKWLAAVLSVVATPIGFLYVGRAGWAVVYLLIALTLAVYGVFLAPSAAIAGALNLAFLLVCAIHAWRMAKAFPADGARSWFSRWYGLLGVAIGFVVLVLAFRSFAYEPFQQPSRSMLPTLPMGTQLVVKKWGYGNYGTLGGHFARRPMSGPLERGDIVVFEYPKDRSVHYIKRVVGLPGDKVAYSGKSLSVNDVPAAQQPTGEIVNEEPSAIGSVMNESLFGRQYTILVDASRPEPGAPPLDFPMGEQCNRAADALTCQVPAGHFFVLGDNRDNSADSRYWGFVPADHLVGKLVYFRK